MSTGADLEGSSLKWLDEITKQGTATTARTNKVLASSATRLLTELQGVYAKVQEKGKGQYEAQQLYSRLRNLKDLLPPEQQKSLEQSFRADLAKAQATGGKSGTDLAKILGNTSDTLKKTAAPNVPAIEAAGKRLGDFWAKENTAFRDRVTALTQTAAAEGKSWRQLSLQVRELLVLERNAGTESARSQRINARMGIAGRAELIARTELQTAFVQGQISRYRETGYDWARWSASAERSCPFCIARDGLVYLLEDVESAIPAHPRCRCSLIPAQSPDEWKNKRFDDKGVDAAESLDDAYWARSREEKIRQFQRSNPKIDDAQIRKYARTPTNSQQYLKPGQPAPDPIWAPSGQLIPNLERVIANTKKAAARASAKEQEAKKAEEEAKATQKKKAEEEARQAEEERKRLEREAREAEEAAKRLAAQQEAQAAALKKQNERTDNIAKLKRQKASLEGELKTIEAELKPILKRIEELKSQRESIANQRSLRRDLDRELASARADQEALQKRFGEVAIKRSQLNSQLKIAQEKLANLKTQGADSAKSGTKTKFDIDEYDKTIARQNHDIDTLKKIGEDVLKRAGVTLTQVKQPSAGGGDEFAVKAAGDDLRRAKAYEDATKKNLAVSRKNVRTHEANREYSLQNAKRSLEAGRIDQKTYDQRVKDIEANTLKAKDKELEYQRDAEKKLADYKQKRIEAEAKLKALESKSSSATSGSAAQAVIDELIKTSPISRKQAQELVEQAAGRARIDAGKDKSRGAIKLKPIPKDGGLDPMIDAVHMYGTRSSMDIYGLKSDRAHASTRQANRVTGETLQGAQGYVNSGSGGSTYRGTQFHELGHHLEFQNSDFYRAARQFIQRRVDASDMQVGRPQWLGGGYGRQEVGYGNAKAYDKYVLKEYDYDRVNRAEVYVPDIHKQKTIEDKFKWLRGEDYTGLHQRFGLATEVTSMGVEKLASARDLQRFAEQDEEHMLLILGMVKVQQARAKNNIDKFGGKDAQQPVTKESEIPDGATGGKPPADESVKLTKEIKDLEKSIEEVDGIFQKIKKESDAASQKASSVWEETNKMPTLEELTAKAEMLEDQSIALFGEKSPLQKKELAIKDDIKKIDDELSKLTKEP